MTGGSEPRSITLDSASLSAYGGANDYLDTFVADPQPGVLSIAPDDTHSGVLAPDAEKRQAATLDGVPVRCGRVTLRLRWSSLAGAREEKFSTPLSLRLPRAGA